MYSYASACARARRRRARRAWRVARGPARVSTAARLGAARPGRAARTCALTRVSVPSTGSAKASITMIVGPFGWFGSILPCIRPITSSEPPERACITILISASAEIDTCLK